MSSESSGFGELHSVNPANKFLGYLQAGPGRIGFVDEVNGAGGVDANGYVPTVFELTYSRSPLVEQFLRHRRLLVQL